MNNYDFKVNLYENMTVTVVAENKEEAKRILNETLDSITIQEIKDRLSNNVNVEIKDSNLIRDIQDRHKERGAER